jgi:hypothetical protein
MLMVCLLPGGRREMTALRKPDALTGGYKIGYWKSQGHQLTDAEARLLMLLLDHIGLEGCFPSQETLARESGWSQTKVRRVRDALAKKGIIGYVAGNGHASTRYSIPGLFAFTDAEKQKKAPRVPESASQGAPQGGTEPSNPSLNGKTAGPDLKVVGIEPKTGWLALIAEASEQEQRWLKLLTVDKVEGGCTFLTTQNPAAIDRVRKMLEEDLNTLAQQFGVGPDHVKMRCLKPATDKEQPSERPTVPLTAAGQNEVADKLEAASDGPIEPLKTVHRSFPADSNVTSLDAFRTKREGEWQIGGPQQESWEDPEDS